jgi:hypothetical protein
LEDHTVAKLVHAELETNHHNSDGCALTLYFDEEPTEDEVKAGCREAHCALGVDPNDQFFSWEVLPTPLSEKAGWVRVQCHPTC